MNSAYQKEFKMINALVTVLSKIVKNLFSGFRIYDSQKVLNLKKLYCLPLFKALTRPNFNQFSRIFYVGGIKD